MKENKEISPTIFDEYFSNFDVETVIKLKQMREIITNAAPEAKEVISYAIPTYVLNGNLVHFAGYKNHIGFYPGPSGIEEYKDELVKYKKAKGSIQFPLNQVLPKETIAKIVKFRVEENLRKGK